MSGSGKERRAFISLIIPATYLASRRMKMPEISEGEQTGSFLLTPQKVDQIKTDLKNIGWRTLGIVAPAVTELPDDQFADAYSEIAETLHGTGHNPNDKNISGKYILSATIPMIGGRTLINIGAEIWQNLEENQQEALYAATVAKELITSRSGLQWIEPYASPYNNGDVVGHYGLTFLTQLGGKLIESPRSINTAVIALVAQKLGQESKINFEGYLSQGAVKAGSLLQRGLNLTSEEVLQALGNAQPLATLENWYKRTPEDVQKRYGLDIWTTNILLATDAVVNNGENYRNGIAKMTRLLGIRPHHRLRSSVAIV